MEGKIEIAEAASSDERDIARLSYQVGKMHDDALPDYFCPTSEAEHLEVIQKMMKDAKAIVLKAVYDGKVCGFACLYLQDTPRKGFVHSKIGYIYNFGVDEAYQRRGIGAMLLEKAEDFLREKGAETVELNVFLFNQRALAFYKKYGYQALDVNLQKVL